jgi:hypothetical protein
LTIRSSSWRDSTHDVRVTERRHCRHAPHYFEVIDSQPNSFDADAMRSHQLGKLGTRCEGAHGVNTNRLTDDQADDTLSRTAVVFGTAAAVEPLGR